MAVYWQIQGHGFVNYDDKVYITENEHVKSALTRESIIWAFTRTHENTWHPMTGLSHLLDSQLYGLNPKGHHLTSLLFHTAGTLLLFMVFARMTGALWQSGFVAALFALHPLHVESVAWASARKDVLSALFCMLTLWAYIRYAEKIGVKRYLLVVLFFALGLMSKPMLVTLPFVLLLLDYWPLRRFKRWQSGGNAPAPETGVTADEGSDFLRLLWEKVPLLFLSAGLSMVTWMTQQSTGAIKSLELYSLKTRIANALVAYTGYLEKTVWPAGLAVFYPHPGDSLSAWSWMASAVLLAGLTVVVVRMVRRAPYLAVGWFWYLGTLLPVIGIVQVGVQAMADRYTYIPLIGIFIMAAWGLPELTAKWRYRDKVLSVSTGLLISILMTVTWTQVRHWKNSETLFKHAIEVTDGNYLAHNNLGEPLFRKGDLAGALAHYRAAVKIKPDYPKAHNNLGSVLLDVGKTQEAMAHFKAAIMLMPGYADAHFKLGEALWAEKRIQESITHYKAAVKIRPDFAYAHNNLGTALLLEQKTGEAVAHFRAAIKTRPDFAEAHNNLGSALFMEGKIKEAVEHYETAVRIQPNFAPAQSNLEKALLSAQSK